MPTVAIVGASDNPERHAYQALQRYQDRGYTVWPVHPSGRPVAGLTCYRSLEELPGTPDIITLYVNPRTGLKMLDELVAAGARIVWLNPGADSDELQSALERRNQRTVRACNLVALSYGDPLVVADKAED